MEVRLGIPEIVTFVTMILGALGTPIGILFRSLLASKDAEIRAAYASAQQQQQEKELYRDQLLKVLPTTQLAVSVAGKAADAAFGKAGA